MTLTYSEAMLRRAVRIFVVRRVGRSPMAAAGVLLAIVALHLYRTGSTGAVFGFVVAALLFLAIFVIAIWRAHVRTTMGKYRAMGGATAEMIATEDDVTFRSPLGAATLPWTAFVEVWGVGECWTLFTAPAQFMTIPLDGLNLGARTFLADKLPPFKVRLPEPPAGRLTRPEAIALATDAAMHACPGSMMAQTMGFATLSNTNQQQVWTISSQTKGARLVVEIDDATGAVLAVRTVGLR